jgi:hypothetical protein
MTGSATTRRLVCVLLAVSLCAPILAVAAPAAADCDCAADFRALAAPSSTVLLTGAGARQHARQRPSAPSLFTLIPLHGGGSDPGRFAAGVERRSPRSLWTAGPRTGRSPPAIS